MVIGKGLSSLGHSIPFFPAQFKHGEERNPQGIFKSLNEGNCVQLNSFELSTQSAFVLLLVLAGTLRILADAGVVAALSRGGV